MKKNNEHTIDILKEEIEDIRPFLNMDGGDIEFIKYEDGIVYIKLTGACAMCGYQDVTIKDNIESYLKEEVPEIKGVVNVPL